MPFFIADASSNHAGSLSRAKELIKLAKESGADFVKFQHFTAETLISDKGFKNLKLNSHQSKWNKPVYDTYKEFETPIEWIPELAECCKKNEIGFMSTPYNLQALDEIDKYTNVHKIGSGDITYLQLIDAITKKNKKTIISTGASNIEEIDRAMFIAFRNKNFNIVLMQCITNYENKKIDAENPINLNVLGLFKHLWPMCELGISDHTKDINVIISAIALGANWIERHFTDGKVHTPDSEFSLNPNEWKYMVNQCANMPYVLADRNKQPNQNEIETRILQRRCARAIKDLPKGHVLTKDDIIYLRPAPIDSIISVFNIEGAKLNKAIIKDNYFKFQDLEK